MSTIYLDGTYLKIKPRILDAFLPGVFQANGVFETMAGIDGIIMDAKEHIKRLKQGLRVLKIRPPSINPAMLKEVLRRNGLPVARLRLMVWKEGGDVHVLAAALPYTVSPKPYRVCLVQTARPADARLSNVKSLNYRMFYNAFARAHARGFDEALLLNAKGHIFEASRANIFWTKGRVLYTTPLSSGCLDGITRRQTIKQARRLKIPFREKTLTVSVLKKADHAFLTNSLIGIKPIHLAALVQT